MFRNTLFAALLVLAGSAMAADISYNYVQLDYGWVTVEDVVLPGLDIDGDGAGISGSVELGDSWFIEAGYGKTDFDTGLETETIAAGFGFHAPVSGNTDFVAALSYISADFSDGDDSFSDDGWGAVIGIRAMATEQLEIDAALSYAEIGGVSGDVTLGLAAIYNFNDVFSAGANVSFEEDAYGYGLGVRFYWGK